MSVTITEFETETITEKSRDRADFDLWTDVTRHTSSTDLTTQDRAIADHLGKYLADTFERVLDEMVDDMLDGMLDGSDAASSSTVRSIARCSDGNGTLTHLFFSDDEFDIARAKAICSKCRLAPSCLEGALERSEAYGVWGGELLIDGVIVAVKRGRGRPPKTPRPILVVDEVPIPPHLVA